MNSRRKILYVVDSEDQYELVRLMLGPLGLEVAWARGIASALEAAASGQFDLYLIDNWRLCDGNGVELCRQLQSVDPDTPVLYYSANVDPKQVESALAAGGIGYITLPDVHDVLPAVLPALFNAEATAGAADLREQTAAVTPAGRLGEPERRKIKASLRLAFLKAGTAPSNLDRLWPKAGAPVKSA